MSDLFRILNPEHVRIYFHASIDPDPSTSANPGFGHSAVCGLAVRRANMSSVKNLGPRSWAVKPTHSFNPGHHLFLVTKTRV